MFKIIRNINYRVLVSGLKHGGALIRYVVTSTSYVAACEIVSLRLIRRLYSILHNGIN